MNLPIQFTSYSSQWKEISDADYAELRLAIPTLPGERPEYGTHDTHILTHEAVPIVQRLGLEIKVSSEQSGVGQMLVKLQDQINDMKLHQASKTELIEKGAAVQIAVPGFALMTINQVQVLDDACTYNLQDQLDDGWHIIAVCPPNATRRPDYVLGRNMPRRK